MLKRIISFSVLACAMVTAARAAGPDLNTLAKSFADPPPQARPWVYWTWIDGNMNKAGVTADLEAMKRVGIGGAIILDVDQSTPVGPIKFFDAQWQELFKHTVAEAKRLSMEININNGPGYFGSGGPWIAPDQAMQVVVQSETHIQGGGHWTGLLPKPGRSGDAAGRAVTRYVDAPEYRDIAVLAVSENQKPQFQIANLQYKAVAWRGWVAYRGGQSAPLDAVAPADAIIPLDHVIDLSGKMDADGKLTWDAPAGEWTVIRFGHAWNGRTVGPSRPEETGPESDKLSKSVTAFHFNTFVKRLNEVVGPGIKDSLVATHIDSWEGGGQNWTTAMREEFKKRRGYDPIPYLPILANRVLGDLQISERFLFDLRKTVSELMIENYSAEFQRLAHANGLRNTYESYTTIGQDLDNAAFTDEPMAEFWTPNGQGLDFQPTVKSMSSAAHLNGHAIVGAESFTSGNREKFMWHPAMIKSIGDNAFVGGVNRFVFHRYAGQPFAEGVKPGMQMGPWGLHYERTNTWWDFTKPWHEYLARCQYLLRQGNFVADVVQLVSEEPILRFQDYKITGYDYDACGPDTFLGGKVVDGKFVFPGGMQYRLIVLSNVPTMTVPLLSHIRDLVRQGAAILGDPPQKTPGLTDYPKSDADLKKLADEIWGTDSSITDRKLGSGRVFRGVTAEKALAELAVSPDFTSDSDIKYIHRNVDGMDVYFLSHPGNEETVANCTFRIIGRQPEFWDPETGRISPLGNYENGVNGTRISIPFDPSGSGFIVFRTGTSASRVETTKSPKPALTELAAITGPWQLHFPTGWGAPVDVKLDNLISWSEHPDSGVKYFSGTATYSKTLNIPTLANNQRVYLDLGNVQIMAKVRLNGKDLGVLWKPPYRVDISAAAKAGDNALEIDVVNNWVNRLIGDEQLPEDSDRNTNGTLKSWPQWFLDGKPSPTGRLTFSSWRLWKKADPLQESGLIGPVTLRTDAK